MSASERDRFNNIHLSNYFLSGAAHTDQSARAVTDPAKAIYPRPPLTSRPQLNVGNASCGASPPPLERARLQNAVPRARLTDGALPWQARAKPPAAGLPSISMPGVPDSDHGGGNAPRFDETDDSFADATKLAGNIIVIIDNRALVRDCLAHCLQAAYISHQVFAFATLSDWMKTEDDYPTPSVILLCVQTRQKKAIDDSDDVDNLARIAVSAPLIIISDVEDGSRIMRAIESGVRGYIPTSMTLGVAVEAVRLVEAGGTFVPINCVMASSQNQGNGGSQMFTARQIMVVEALCRGKANKQIAYELGMCESTVKVHIRHIMRKLKARNRTEVAMMASSLFDKFVDHKSRPDT
ncbi:MAG: response regulator transcription factor [Nitrobacter sp.]